MEKQQSTGSFIVFEGGEGSGKSTQIAKLRDRLSDDAVFTREPGGTPTAEKIRDIMLTDGMDDNGEDGLMSHKTELMLVCAARADHIKRLIKPSLAAGKTVICDRFDLSTFAYQIYGDQKETEEKFFTVLNNYIIEDCVPDAYIYLQIDTEEGLGRIENRVAGNRFDAKEVAFHRRVKAGYDRMSKRLDNCFVIDASQPMDVVADRVCEVVKKFT